MADIGRSTAEHQDSEKQDTGRHALNYPDGHEALDNFGAWFRNADDGHTGSFVQPMFRGIKEGYREASSLRTHYDEDLALDTDRMIGTLLKESDISIIFCRYVKCMPSRIAAKTISTNKDKVTVNEYALRLEAVVARIDVAIQIREENENQKSA